jgi:hypothetical protein
VYARWDANTDPGGSLLKALGAACELDRITRHINETRPNLPQQLKIGVGINIGNAAPANANAPTIARTVSGRTGGPRAGTIHLSGILVHDPEQWEPGA